MHLVEIVATLIALYVLYLFACFLITYARKRNVEIELAHVGDRVSEATRRRLPELASPIVRPEVLRDPRFRRGGIAS